MNYDRELGDAGIGYLQLAGDLPRTALRLLFSFQVRTADDSMWQQWDMIGRRV